jgi:hypothetical protein
LVLVAAGQARGQTLYEASRPYLERQERVVPGDASRGEIEQPAVFGRLTTEDWAALIDATWDWDPQPGFPLSLFDALWAAVDEEYGAFVNLDVDLDAIRDRYRDEIAAGVSRGRYAAIFNQFAFALKDSHTYFIDGEVNWGTYPEPGVPLFVVGAWLDNSRFGAGLTPLEDDTLLVYKALPDHVLGLEPGDIVLGYDGVPWYELYRQLLEA